LQVELRKAILFFLVVFSTWQVLYIFNWLLNGIDWLFAYSIVLAVVTCFFLLDKQKMSDLGLKKPLLWKRYVMIGFGFAVLVIIVWFGISLPLPFTAHEIFGHGILSIPYNALFALVVGLVEETSFRGYILGNLRKVCSNTKAITYSALLFGLYHVSIVLILLSATPAPNPFTYWSSYVLFTFVVGLFLGYFCVNSGGTIIGTVTHHSSHIFLSSLIPYELATSFTIGHIINTGAYAIVLMLLLIIKEKGWLR
jgi:membrane protease YdiL (CAAX protease family)